MTTSPRLGFTYLAPGQTLPETAVNEIAAFLEAAAGHFIIVDRDLAAPPGSPTNGQCYLVAASPTGAWAGHAGAIALYLNTARVFVAVTAGLTSWILDEPGLYGFDGLAWNLLASASGSYLPASYLDTDGTLAANSDAKVASQKAVKTYVAAAVTGLLDLKGTTDCSANPNYPAASKGDAYVVTVAGKIGGASGASVSVGDVYFATADNAGGTQASVGASWDVLVHSGGTGGSALATANEWAPNFTANGDVYIPAVVAMTIDQGNAAIGTGSIAFAKSTTAAPGTFTTTTLPATLQAGAWLRVTATGVSGFVATHLKRTA